MSRDSTARMSTKCKVCFTGLSARSVGFWLKAFQRLNALSQNPTQPRGLPTRRHLQKVRVPRTFSQPSDRQITEKAGIEPAFSVCRVKRIRSHRILYFVSFRFATSYAKHHFTTYKNLCGYALLTRAARSRTTYIALLAQSKQRLHAAPFGGNSHIKTRPRARNARTGAKK